MKQGHRLGMAVVCLRISSALYVLIGVGMIALANWLGDDPELPYGRWLFIAVGAFCITLAAIPEIAVFGIRRRRFWGWILGLILFALYLPSLFLPLGAFGMWGLLDPRSRTEMGIKT